MKLPQITFPPSATIYNKVGNAGIEGLAILIETIGKVSDFLFGAHWVDPLQSKPFNQVKLGLHPIED